MGPIFRRESSKEAAVVGTYSSASSKSSSPRLITTTTTTDGESYKNNNTAVLPLSMRFFRACGAGACCCSCQTCKEPLNKDENGDDDDDEVLFDETTIDLGARYNTDGFFHEGPLTVGTNTIENGVPSLVRQPMLRLNSSNNNNDLQAAHNSSSSRLLERILLEYKQICQFYNIPPNIGVVATLRYQLPSLRTTTATSRLATRENAQALLFQDADMMAVAELLFRYANGPLRFIRRLDFTVPRRCTSITNRGFGSHGAVALAKVLQTSGTQQQQQHNIQEVYLDRNRVGPFGAAALFVALADNPTVRNVSMRGCRVSERGGIAFATQVLRSRTTSLQSVDLSANHIGYRGCIAIERAVAWRSKRFINADDAEDDDDGFFHPIILDLEGNLVFQEIMNGVTHGLGVLLAVLGAWLLSAAVAGKSRLHTVSCAVYSTSLVVLYSSSTLYHSFFSLRNTKYVFEVMDKCAIYILISGSYTPCLQIVLSHEPVWSTNLLAFLWVLCFVGICVEFAWPTWPAKYIFSLCMYLCMGWSALVCLPEVARMIPQEAVNLMVLGGVAYTIGVPFFIRDNNLDHAIWHIFVLTASIFHWCGIYFYIINVEHPSVN